MVMHTWLNFVNFRTKIWPSKQLRATNRLQIEFLTYSTARQSVLRQLSFCFWEISLCPIKLYIPHHFCLCKVTATNDIKNGSIRPCIVHRTVCWWLWEMLYSNNRFSSNSIELSVYMHRIQWYTNPIVCIAIQDDNIMLCLGISTTSILHCCCLSVENTVNTV